MSLILKDVSISVSGASSLFAPLSLEVVAGQICTIMGPSGAGKSTLLAGIGGHLAPEFTLSGEITLNGIPLNETPPQTRRVGLMFQDAVLFPHLSLGENLAFGLPAHVKGRAARRAAVEDALSRAGLQGMGARDPATLSGGERSRAALMRCLLAEPFAILLDEPFSKLDTALRAELRRFTFEHIRARAIPTLMVTHDREDANAAGGTQIALDRLS